jgi:hypothetical protein
MAAKPKTQALPAPPQPAPDARLALLIPDWVGDDRSPDERRRREQRARRGT